MLEEILVTRKFLDVFLVELLGMPSDREIEFFINMVRGTTPISKALY